jgi:hypothetical protein
MKYFLSNFLLILYVKMINFNFYCWRKKFVVIQLKGFTGTPTKTCNVINYHTKTLNFILFKNSTIATKIIKTFLYILIEYFILLTKIMFLFRD